MQGLSAGVTLDGKSGEQGGAPYLTLPATSIAPGASITVTTTFTNPIENQHRLHRQAVHRLFLRN